MQVKTKVIKIRVFICGSCKQRLQGKDTFLEPFFCPCGVWDYDFDSKAHILGLAFKKPKLKQKKKKRKPKKLTR